MADSPWYKSFEDSQYLMVHLVQCDLARHTSWFSRCRDAGRGWAATNAKKELADSLKKAVAPRFAVVFWRGDGGMYAAKQAGTNGDVMVETALAIRSVFRSWQDRAKWADLNLGELALRLSCHTCNVWVGDEPAYWTSVDLNRFVKYERKLSHEDALAITHATFLELKDMGPQFAKWTKWVYVNDEAPQKWKVHYHRDVGPDKAVGTTIDWFRRRFGGSIQLDAGVVAESQRFSLGQSIVLYITPSSHETLDIELEEEKGPPKPFDSPPSGQARWEYLKRKLVEEIGGAQEPPKRGGQDPLSGETGLAEERGKQVDLEKLSPLKLRMPIKDFPIAKITYRPARYSTARSFLECLGADSDLWTWYADRGVDYAEDAPRRPGILCAHVVLITNDTNGNPHVVLAQRSGRQEEHVGFHQRLWSATLEEQIEQNDGTVRAAAVRGLREELLGGEAEKVSANVAALFLERSFLNLSIGVVCRTSLSIGEIHHLWLSCVDHDENRQIIALPLTGDLVRGCIGEGKLTDAARRQCQVQDAHRRVWTGTNEWTLHPTSAFRLALALRAVESK
jgi:hypothetical protein